MMHEPDCPLFNQTIEGEGRKRKKTLIRVIADQLPKPRKLFENEKNALKISGDVHPHGDRQGERGKIISEINQHVSKAKKTSATTDRPVPSRVRP